MTQYNTWLKCLNIDYNNNTALVQSKRTGKSFPVHIPQNMKFLISKGDYLHVIKSHVSREWIAIDYNAMFGMTAGDEEEVETCQ